MGLFSFGKSNASASRNLNWSKIETLESLQKAIAGTDKTPAIFFKHSTRCSISSMALNRFEKEWDESNNCDIYFIDLIANRDVSNTLSEIVNVQHQSPQVLLIENGKCVYNASHSGIDAEEIKVKL